MEIKPGSALTGKREIERLNGHSVVVIVPENVNFQEGKKKLIKILEGLE